MKNNLIDKRIIKTDSGYNIISSMLIKFKPILKITFRVEISKLKVIKHIKILINLH